ncbi:MAG: creatininase family protein [Bacteroidales bacterium]|nr:creatininase family protein [Bacteroidales bacterium]
MYSKFDITAARWGDVKKKHYHLAILPWGSCEPHNYHLPYCTDMLHAQAVAFEAAEKVSKKGVNAMVLPGIPLGSQNPGQIELPFCIHTSQRTQIAVLEDIVASLKKQGINKLLIMNGHGGNNFKGMIRDIMIKNPGFMITVVAWFSILPLKDFFEEKIDDHGGEQETSVMMHYYPELVNLKAAGDGKHKDFKIKGLNTKVAWAPRDWKYTTKDTGVGNPKKATAEKGKRYIQAAMKEIVSFITDFAKADTLY